ncbi:MAG: transcription antitermination factor NusB [Lachnospiraceae bacterium]|jgi:N utilization substance protein B|nr:transcription antitermination factor NusB [Lachnospiraceae bacterium]MEE3461008.1 transcription antitermination factor NusB [Lachnospiraceae bacterium]
MEKSKFREKLFKLVYLIEFHERAEIMEEAQLNIESFEENISEKTAKQLKKKLGDILDRIDDIDKIIDQKSEKWDTERIGKADLASLRLGIYEMVYDDNVPINVAVKEAVVLADTYGTDKSYAFVNGILSAVASDDSIKKVDKNARVKRESKDHT